MENWFGAGLRTSMAVEVADILHGTRKKGYYLADGTDVRLSAPGVRWADLRQVRENVLETFKTNCQEAFDSVYQQIIEGRRTSMTQHVLPAMKTPGISKTKSCRRLSKKLTLSPQPTPPPSSSISDPVDTPLSSVFTPRSVAQMNSDIHDVVVKPPPATDNVTKHDKENVPVTNTVNVSQSALGRRKLRSSKTDVSRDKVEGSTRRVTRANVRGGVAKSPLSTQTVKKERVDKPATEAACADSPRIGGRQTRSRAKCSAVSPATPLSPLLRSQRKRLCNVSQTATTARRELRSSNRAATKPTTSAVAMSPEKNQVLTPNKCTEHTEVLTPPNKRIKHTEKNQVLTSPNKCTEHTEVLTPPNKHKNAKKADVVNKNTPIVASEISTPPTQPPNTDCSALQEQWYTALTTMRQTPTTVTCADIVDHIHTFKSKVQVNLVHDAASKVANESPSIDDFHTPDCVMESPATSSDQCVPTCKAVTTSVPEYSADSDSGVDSKEDREKRSETSLEEKQLHCVSLERLSITSTDLRTSLTHEVLPAMKAPGGLNEQCKDAERRSGNSLGGKRLRSVSLEKLSISEFETKRISLCVESNDPPDTGGNEGVPLPVSSPEIDHGKEPETSISDDNTPSGESEDCETSPPVCTSDDIISEDSQENMHTSPPCTLESDTPTGSGSEGGVSSSPGEEVTTCSPTCQQPQNMQTGTESDPVLKRSPVINLKKTKASPWSILSKKPTVPLRLMLPSESRPATFLSPKSPRILEGAGKAAVLNGTAASLSFLPRNSPQQINKAERRMARQHKLMERMQRKREEEEQRKRDLEEKRLQDIEQKKRRNAERAQRAAENRKQEEEKKLMLRKKAQEVDNEEISKKQQKMNKLRANERKEKTKKHNEHVAAVLARKKQEEEQKAKKLKQIEEDRKMVEELHKQRLEKEEEERQARRAEKLRQERDRQQLREAEERERQMDKKEDKPEAEVSTDPTAKRPLPENKKEAFQQLLASSCTVNMPTAAGRFIQEWKNKARMNHGTATVTKSHPTLPGTIHDISLEKCPPPLPHDTAKDPSQTSTDLNSTFTKDVSSTAEESTKDVLVTPLKTSTHRPNADSYTMTPAQPVSYNYDINDLSSGDSTDEEDHPKKPIPGWAITSQLKPIMILQEKQVHDLSVDPSDIFPSRELLKDVDLARIFKQKRKRFYHRSSSARWDSPVLLKKGKIDSISAGFV